MSPSPLAVRLLLAWLGLAVIAVIWPPSTVVWAGTGVVLAALSALDAPWLVRPGPFEVTRDVSGALAVGTWSRVVLHVTQRARRPVRVWLYDHPPATFLHGGLPALLRLEPEKTLSVEYRVHPQERGPLRFERSELVVLSPLQLWRRRLRVGAVQSVRVYPNFQRIREYARLAVDQHTVRLGVHQRRRRGEGMDFHQLREYRAGDSLRQIDWKTTARLAKTISREYQEERDQQLVVMIDCGRRMHARDGELTHFDHALDAILLVSHVALRHGDAVGILSTRPQERWVAPRKGVSHHRVLVNAVYDLQSSEKPVDYLALAEAVALRVRKRALLILVTNVRDEDQQELMQAMTILRRRHLVIAASLRERALGETLDKPIHSDDDAVRAAATHLYLEARDTARNRLRAAGLRIVDTEPGQLAIALVNRYLEVKREALL